MPMVAMKHTALSGVVSVTYFCGATMFELVKAYLQSNLTSMTVESRFCCMFTGS